MRRQAGIARPSGGPLIDNVLVLVVPAAAEEISRVRHALVDFLQVRGVSSVVVEDMQLVVSELATNAVMYGLGSAVEVVLAVTGEIRLTVSNDGPATSIPPPDQWRPALPTADSGRGLGIVRRLSDRVDVHDHDGRTTVEIRRVLPDGGPDWHS